jgi:exodeoxyribonuclease-3
MRVLSWNVNGLRAVLGKGCLEFIRNDRSDVLCIQETKMSKEHSPIASFPEFHQYYSFAVKKGYSGVATWSRAEPIEVEYGLGIERFDAEGRTLITHYQDLVLVNCYFPNGKQGSDRLQYKMDFYEAFLDRMEGYRKQKNVVFCGDVNTAHREIDLARPKENEDVSGFLPLEREWIDKLTDRGYVDTFRAIHGDEVAYSWWDYKTRARERDIGWRIDYFFINKELLPNLKDAFVLPEVMGSDHCPVGIEMGTCLIKT